MARPVNLLPSVALAALLAVWSNTGCTRNDAAPSPASNRTPLAYVVHYPLQYFAQRIGGDAIDVRFPAPADDDPAFWSPGADAVAAYQSADLILLNGAGYAKWIPRVSLPASKMVDTSASFANGLIEIEESATHTHGPSGKHAHTGTAFTTWLDFDLAAAQARAVHNALVELRPERADAFAANLSALIDELHELDEQMMSIAGQLGDAPLVASHPVYQYWARRYGLNLRSVMWEPDVVPDDRAIDRLRRLLAEHPATIMIWEAEPDPRSRERLKGLGLRSIVYDPCGNAPGQGDFLTVMRQNTAALEAEGPRG